VNAQPPRVRVLVADDHAIYRRGLVSAVNERAELELVGEAETGDLALDALWQLQPDVTLVDLGLPGLDVLSAIDHEELPTRVVVLSTRTDGSIAHAAIRAGAKAYLSKEATPEQLCDAILAVARGDTVLPPELDDDVAGELRERAADARLTSRERQVLELAAGGMSPYDVGRRLYLSSATLGKYVQGFCEKLGVTEVPDAVAEAKRRGLIR
jgi:two-component system nitrate/nitrite response regulator NarL